MSSEVFAGRGRSSPALARAARAGARVLAVAGDGSAVDIDGANARREATRIVVGGDVGDARRIEDDEVGEGAGTHGAAVNQLELGGRHACHAMDGGGQVQHFRLAPVVAEGAL